MSLVTIVIQSVADKPNEAEIKTFATPALPVNEPVEVDAVQSLAITMLNAVTDDHNVSSTVDHAA